MNEKLSRVEVRLQEVIAEYGIAIAFIAINIWLRNNSAQHARKIKGYHNKELSGCGIREMCLQAKVEFNSKLLQENL